MVALYVLGDLNYILILMHPWHSLNNCIRLIIVTLWVLNRPLLRRYRSILRHNPDHLWLHLSSHHHYGVHVLLLAPLHHVLLLRHQNSSLGKLRNLLMGKYLRLTKTWLVLNSNNMISRYATYRGLDIIWGSYDLLNRFGLWDNIRYLLLMTVLSFDWLDLFKRLSIRLRVLFTCFHVQNSR
jgi:hypothetical protein